MCTMYIRSNFISDEIKLNKSHKFYEDSHTFMQPGKGRPIKYQFNLL
jgi:hypothetical protein